MDAARALTRMDPSMARSIEVVGLESPATLIAIAADRIATSLDLVATVRYGPSLTVRFERR